MLQQLFRVVLLTATGGVLYYDQLWDVGLKYSNYIINTTPWADDSPSPISRLSGFPNRRSKNMHVFGAYCLFHVPKELRDGKFRPPSEMGIWVGLDPNCTNGHFVVPIEWQHSTQSWVLHEVVTATTVKVYEEVFPLRKAPPPGTIGTVKFDEFVDDFVNPLYESSQKESVIEKPQQVVPEKASPEKGAPQYKNPNKQKGPKPKSTPEKEYELEEILDTRIKKVKGKGVKQYLVKWKGYKKSENSWVDVKDLNSPELVSEYNNKQTGRTKKDIVGALTALMITENIIGNSLRNDILPNFDVDRAVESLMRKQKLTGGEDKFAIGVNTELTHMLDKRLELISDPAEAAKIMVTEPVVSLRMQLELKKDWRRKARLLLQGFKEPEEWDLESNVSPVAFPSTIRTLVFKSGPDDEVLSSIDVSVAFLQTDKYGPNERPRYVSWRPYTGGPNYVFKLLGPIYGQRSAPRAWYKKITKWLIEEMGYTQAQNEPCLFTHENGHCMALHVDDLICRGTREISTEFYRKMKIKFECKDPEFLEPGNFLTFTGLDIGLERDEKGLIYSISQERELLAFLKNKGLDKEPKRASPMPRRETILTEGEVDQETGTWARSCLGGLHHFSRMTRWDICHSVSRTGQTTQNPKQGTIDQLKQIAGFLNNTSAYKLKCRRVQGRNIVSSMTDSNHHGDPKFTSNSQTGVIGLLNGAPAHWRSNRQPKSTQSPTESEIYALSTGVKDVRLFYWVLEEMTHVVTQYPILIQTDSSGARSFQRDTCPSTKLRGCFDFRERWVEELRDQGTFSTELVSDSNNLADIFTKCLSNVEFTVRRNKIRDSWKTR